MEKRKSEVGNLPGYSSLGEIQKDLIERLISGFRDNKEYLDWRQDMIHSSFGNEESVREIISLTREGFKSMYIDRKEPHKKYFREQVAQYLIVAVFPLPQRFFSGRAKENSSGGEKGGMRREEEQLFRGEQ